jgi:hypothetical protein
LSNDPAEDRCEEEDVNMVVGEQVKRIWEEMEDYARSTYYAALFTLEGEDRLVFGPYYEEAQPPPFGTRSPSVRLSPPTRERIKGGGYNNFGVEGGVSHEPFPSART